jgi:hypothetical protein
MKYEDYGKLKSICEQIEKEEALLHHLSHETLEIKISSQGNTIQTIGAWNSSEHRHRDIVKVMIADMRVDIESRIARLKTDLAEL